ncbi:MAG: hypothetical protein J6589_01590 [Snodgrassella sp.]|nr:hypothetical protein [Snodgrassella sp.]
MGIMMQYSWRYLRLDYYCCRLRKTVVVLVALTIIRLDMNSICLVQVVQIVYGRNCVRVIMAACSGVNVIAIVHGGDGVDCVHGSRTIDRTDLDIKSVKYE